MGVAIENITVTPVIGLTTGERLRAWSMADEGSSAKEIAYALNENRKFAPPLIESEDIRELLNFLRGDR